MKIVVGVVGALFIALGLFWFGQGAGLTPSAKLSCKAYGTVSCIQSSAPDDGTSDNS
jgi:uncharacterized membrane protein